ncbi:MAG: hypothetical protein DRP66_01405 [Planctomycetota bacterium]|nr:MAG: hypothetical protein DRP66_01405 [Planctomycetota bacterium]
MFAGLTVICAGPGGCGKSGLGGYTNDWLYPRQVDTVYVEMFDSRSFRRGHEYVLTDAICKRIEVETPYKIVSDRDFADSVLSGQINSIGSGVLAVDRETGRPLEREVLLRVTVNWKDLETGELLINNETVTASSTYSAQLGQDFDYSAAVAANRAARKVVELMEETW